MKKNKFYLTFPRHSIDYVIDKITDHQIQILKKSLIIMTVPFICIGYKIIVLATEEEFKNLLGDMIPYSLQG